MTYILSLLPILIRWFGFSRFKPFALVVTFKITEIAETNLYTWLAIDETITEFNHGVIGDRYHLLIVMGFNWIKP